MLLITLFMGALIEKIAHVRFSHTYQHTDLTALEVYIYAAFLCMAYPFNS